MFSKQDGNRFNRLWITFFLLMAIFAVYWQTVGHEFISYDDTEYITENPAILQGLTISSTYWAFTTFHASNWHPLTWLSHLLDVELFGLNPAGHHLINIILHSVNSILLFLLLNRYSGFLWRSAVVAALFALHPLHVESVAWVAERKDLLSTLFWLLTLYLYAGYAGKPGRARYFLLLATYALGLMAKPMLVTLPLVMLLLDYWPLQRLDTNSLSNNCHSRNLLSGIQLLRLLKSGFPIKPSGMTDNVLSAPCYEPADSSACPKRTLIYLLKEKIPFLLLAVVSAIVTIFAQQAALSSLSATTLTERIANGLTAYLAYLGKTVLPQNLAVFYQFNHELSWLAVLGAAALLSAISILAVKLRRTRPYLFVGWFWYIITLVPVIGIVQVGMQARADRYTYIPLIGIFILVVWGAAEITATWAYRRATLTIVTAAVLTACVVTSWQQVTHWQNSTTLFTHAIKATDKNFIAHFRLGYELEQQGRIDEAVISYKAAQTDNPVYGPTYGRLGKISYEGGKLADAIFYYYKELMLNPLSVYCRNNLGIALADNGQLDEAIDQFRHALKLQPDFTPAQNNLQLALEAKKSAGGTPVK